MDRRAITAVLISAFAVPASFANEYSQQLPGGSICGGVDVNGTYVNGTYVNATCAAPYVCLEDEWNSPSVKYVRYNCYTRDAWSDEKKAWCADFKYVNTTGVPGVCGLRNTPKTKLKGTVIAKEFVNHVSACHDLCLSNNSSCIGYNFNTQQGNCQLFSSLKEEVKIISVILENKL